MNNETKLWQNYLCVNTDFRKVQYFQRVSKLSKRLCSETQLARFSLHRRL